uniref:Uncharacterized protein n=1 Tax=Romanomermis culicivorax TaxID=13658 RepID=A0A915IW27_ROMCU
MGQCKKLQTSHDHNFVYQNIGTQGDEKLDSSFQMADVTQKINGIIHRICWHNQLTSILIENKLNGCIWLHSDLKLTAILLNFNDSQLIVSGTLAPYKYIGAAII